MEKKRTPANIDRQARRRKNALRGAVTATAASLLAAAVLLWLRQAADPNGFVSRLALAVAVLDLLMVFPIWVSLRERLREIEKGEEEDASQY